MSVSKKTKASFLWIFLLISIAMRLVNLTIPIINEIHSFRQTQTAITVQRYLEDGFSLFQYRIPVFGPNWTALMEFPIYQSIVYFLTLLLGKGNLEIAGRLVTMLCFYLSVWCLWKICNMYLNKNQSKIILIFYIFSPFTIYWSRTFMIDYCSVCLGLLYVWLMLKWIREGNMSYYIATFLVGSVAYLCKITTMFPMVYFLSIMILYEEAQKNNIVKFNQIKETVWNNKVHIIGLAILCVLPAVIGVAWTHYADLNKLLNPYTVFLSSDSLKGWNYGLWKQKLDISNWNTVINRIISGFFPGVLIVLLAFFWKIDIYDKKIKCFCAAIALSIIGTIFTIFNLFYVHDYYLMAISPFVCIFGGLIFEAISHRMNFFGCITLALLLTFSSLQGSQYMTFIADAEKSEQLKTKRSVGHTLKNITTQDENIIITDAEWDPSILYSANRKGFMVRRSDFVTVGIPENFVKTLKDNNFTTYLSRIGSEFYSDIVKNWRIIYKCYNSIEKDTWQVLKLFDDDEMVESRFAGYGRLVQEGAEPISSNYIAGNKFEDIYALPTLVKAKVVKIECSNPIDDGVITFLYKKGGGEEVAFHVETVREINLYYIELCAEESLDIQDFSVRYDGGIKISELTFFVK